MSTNVHECSRLCAATKVNGIKFSGCSGFMEGTSENISETTSDLISQSTHGHEPLRYLY